jgi:hypothetical protein
MSAHHLDPFAAGSPNHGTPPGGVIRVRFCRCALVRLARLNDQAGRVESRGHKRCEDKASKLHREAVHLLSSYLFSPWGSCLFFSDGAFGLGLGAFGLAVFGFAVPACGCAPAFDAGLCAVGAWG